MKITSLMNHHSLRMQKTSKIAGLIFKTLWILEKSQKTSLFRSLCKQSSTCIQWSYQGSTKKCLLFNKVSSSSFAPGFISGPKCCHEEYGTKYCGGSHQTTSPTPKPPEMTTPEPNQCECGRYFNATSAKARIWNGQKADPMRDPWMVFLKAMHVRHY